MNPRIIILFMIIFLPASLLHTKDEKPKSFEEYKKEIKEKFKDADIVSLIEGAEKLEEYYKLKSASIFREIALEKIEKQKKQVDDSLNKIKELLQKDSAKETKDEENGKEIKDTDDEKIEPNNTDNENIKFIKLAEKQLLDEQSLLKIKYERCKHWLEEDNKGKESSILYVNVEKSLIASRESDFTKRIEEIEKYDAMSKFEEADQKRILLKNALSRLIIFIDGKIKAYESTLKSIKKRKKLKDTSVQKKAEKRIEYYKWIKPYAEKFTEIHKARVESEQNIKQIEEMIFFYKNFEIYSKNIDFPEYLKLSKTESEGLVKILNAHIEFLKKDKKNPE